MAIILTIAGCRQNCLVRRATACDAHANDILLPLLLPEPDGETVGAIRRSLAVESSVTGRRYGAARLLSRQRPLADVDNPETARPGYGRCQVVSNQLSRFQCRYRLGYTEQDHSTMGGQAFSEG